MDQPRICLRRPSIHLTFPVGHLIPLAHKERKEETMKATIFTVVVVLMGMLATLLLASFGTYIALNFTPWGRAITEHQQNSSVLWTAIVSGARQLFLFVLLPTVILVSLLVGFFAQRVPPVAAACATLPISVASGIDWEAAVLIFASVAAAFLSYRWRIRRRVSPIESRA